MDRKEAIEVIKKNYHHVGISGSEFESALRELVPELKESEYERIRKLLVWQVHRNIEDETNDLAQSVYDGIKGHDPDLEESIEDWKRCLAYLEKQKEQKPAEWSEEDERMLRVTLRCLDYVSCQGKVEAVKWLKSLRPRPHWKPSEEQMRSLEYFIKLWGDSDDQLEYIKVFNDVKTLYNDLKSL